MFWEIKICLSFLQQVIKVQCKNGETPASVPSFASAETSADMHASGLVYVNIKNHMVNYRFQNCRTQ
jgi:hypothetical protein